MSLNLDRFFAAGQVPGWLRGFDADPDLALHDLLLGRAELGHLAAAEPVELLRGWLRALDQGSEFTAQLDRALAVWITTYWGRIELPGGAASASLTTNAWLRVTGLLAVAPSLTRSGQALGRHLLADQRYLDGLAAGRSSDPQANGWLALAAHQRDRSLLPRWWQLCELPPDQPWYRGHCGIAGLQALPPASAARTGGFPQELAEGLNRFGLALWRLQDQGWLDPELAAEEFRDSLRLKLAVYPSDRWLSFWRHALRRDQRQGDIGGWVREVLPPIAAGETAGGRTAAHQGPTRQRPNKQSPKKPHRPVWASYDPEWPARSTAIVGQLRNGVEGAVEDAERMLAEQRGYFERSGDSSGLVRSATRFSATVRGSRPALALTWARQAKEVEPWNGLAWTNEGAALIAVGDLSGASRVCREAVGRFPDNPVARNTLAEVLKAQGRLPEAAAEYRETKARFPDNTHARTGLAETLEAQGRLQEAEAEYRETLVRFPNDDVARNGLAGVLQALGRLPAGGPGYPQSQARPADGIAVPDDLDRAPKTPDKPEKGRTAGGALAGAGPEKTGPEAVGAGLVAAYRKTRYPKALPRVLQEAVVRNGSAPTYKVRNRPREAAVVATDTAEPPTSPPHGEPAGPAPRAPRDEPRLDRREIEIIANDAFLVRRWAHTAADYSPDLAPGYFRDRAEDLLKKLLPASDRDSIAAGASALLRLDRGELEPALELLRRAVERFPGSARVRYALARAEREAPQGDPLTPWRRLLRLDGHYEPIFFLGAGRAYLLRAMNGDDGATHKARDKLGRLASWIRSRARMDTDRAASDPQVDPRSCFQARHTGDLADWWAVEVQAELFGLHVVAGGEELKDLDPIMERATVHDRRLDRLEEELMLRYARA